MGYWEPTILFCRRNCWSVLVARDRRLPFKLTTYHCRFSGNPRTSSKIRSPLATSTATDSRESTAQRAQRAGPGTLAPGQSPLCHGGRISKVDLMTIEAEDILA